jgi:hypothetical protein
VGDAFALVLGVQHPHLLPADGERAGVAHLSPGLGVEGRTTEFHLVSRVPIGVHPTHGPDLRVLHDRPIIPDKLRGRRALRDGLPRMDVALIHLEVRRRPGPLLLTRH